MRPGTYVPIAVRLLSVNPIDSLPNYTTTITLHLPRSAVKFYNTPPLCVNCRF